MSEELEPRQIENDGITTSAGKLSDRVRRRDVELSEFCVCDCRDCNTYNDVYQQGPDIKLTACEADCDVPTGAGACAAPLTSNARRQANLYANLFKQSLYRPGTSKHIKKRKLQKQHLIKVKYITTKYLQKFKRYISTKNIHAKKKLLKTNRKIKPLTSLIKNYPRRMKKYKVGKTAPRLGLGNSITALKTSTIFSVVSSSNITITAHSKKHHEAHGNNRIKVAANLISKLMLYLKPFFGMIMKSQTTKTLNRKKHEFCEPSTAVLNYIFAYQSNSSNTLDGINKMEWGKESSVLNAASELSSASNSSMQSFYDQGTQVSERSSVGSAIVNVDPFVKKLSTCNAYSQCILRPNDVLLQYRNKNARMVIKKSRRVTFRGHHKRFMTRTYRQNFNKIYHTFLAAIDYTNQPLQLCQNRQGVAIGSTWDVCIDFGKTQDFPNQRGVDPGSDILQPFQCPPGVCVTGECDPNKCFKRLKTQSPQKGDLGQDSGSKPSTLQPYQCPPGVCVTGACNPSACYKRLKRTAPYGSHVSTQSRKYKLRDQRAARENMYGRKKSNMTKRRKIRKGRDSGLAGNQIALTPAGLPLRQAVRIGSKCSFNVKLYKETPLGAQTVAQLKNRQSSGQNGQGNTVRRKAGRTRKKRRPLKTFECQPGICVPGKCSPSECFKQFECQPKVCVPKKCDPSECYRRQRDFTETSLGGSSEVSTQSRRLKGRHLRAGRETIYKEKGILSKPRPKAQLNMPNRQAVRIGSKCSFNIEFYKCLPQSAFSEQDRGDTSDGRKGTAKSGKTLKKYQCEPGVCVPGQCNANECFQQLKTIHSTGTDASFTGSSKVTSQGSQSSKALQKGQRSTLYKDKGSSSMPRSKMPLNMGNRQAVRIGSKCSFNIEFYKCSPHNGAPMRPMSEQTGTGKKRVPLKKYQCEPGVCVPGKCNANECFQVLKTKNESSVYDSSLTGSSRGSQATAKKRKAKARVLKSGKATFYKDAGVSSLPRAKAPLHLADCQSVRIGSTCSFNIEFYKCAPQNGSVTNEQNALQNGFVTNEQNYQFQKSLPKKRKPRSVFECEPGVCIPGKCIPSECFKQFECKPKVCVPGKCDPIDCIQRLRSTPTGTDASFTGSSVSTQSRKFKRRNLRARDKTLYKEKGVSSIPRHKPTLRTPTRQGVRIGSNCSFNIEFYKAMSHPMMGEQNYPPVDFYNRGALKKYECVPGVCVPGKCEPVECYNRIKRSQMSDDQSDSPGLYKADSRKKRKALKKYECVPGVCVPGKCEPVECYNRIKRSQMSDYQSDSPGLYKAGSRKKGKALKKYECPPGVCIPGKCNAKECFQLFKAKRSIDNDGSLTDSSLATSRASQASKKRKKNRPELGAGNATYYTERGASSMPRSKTPLHMQNRQAVRIGSTCSFNIEFYKQIPHKNLRQSNAQQMQNRQHPFQYNIDENRQFPVQYYPSSSETSGDQSTGVTCECRRQPAGTGKKETSAGKKETLTEKKKTLIGKKETLTGKKETLTGKKETFKGKKETSAGKKETFTGKKDTITGKKETFTGKKETFTGKKETFTEKKEKVTGKKEKDKTKQKKQPAGQYDQGDTTVQQKTTSRPGVKSKGPKGKTTQQKESLSQNEQGDATVTPKLSTGSQGQALKAKRTKRKQSQTTVSDQQSETSVNEKVGTDESQDQGDIRNVETKKKDKASKEKLKSTQSDKGFEYELGVCIPNKCDPYLCFERLRNRNEGTSTNVNLGRKEEAERRRTGSLPVYRHTSSLAASKTSEDISQRIPPLGTPSRNKQVVRIGSSCSFNIQIFKDKPLSPAQIASLRSASTQPKPELPEIKPEKLSLVSQIKKCCCRMLGQPNDPVCINSSTGTQHGSQTSQRFECKPGFCDFAKCVSNQCPARFNLTNAGTDTYGNAKRAGQQSCCANAATQSRRCPAVQQMSINDNALSAALCKCVAKMGPARGAPGLRNAPYPSIMPGNWPFGSVAGYGDNFNKYQIREQGVIIGSGCGFNVNFFKKRKK